MPSAKIENSTPFTTYSMTVQAKNAIGYGPESPPIEAQFNFEMPELLHTGTKEFQVPEWVDFMFYEIVKKSDNSRVQLVTTADPFTFTPQGDFILRFAGDENGPWMTTQEFGSKDWKYENYQYGGSNCHCNNNNPCQCCLCGKDCSDGSGWDDWGCYNCCGSTCGPCTGQRPVNYPAPWQYGPGNNTYPYSGSGHWFYIHERNDL